MNRIGIVGISWRHRRPDALALLTIPRDERERRVPELARAIGVSELVYIATCNRVEVLFATDGQTPMTAYRPRIFAALAGRAPRGGEAEQVLSVRQGEGAVEHLFLVAAGLDSARLGESEVTSQVREAMELAKTSGLVGGRIEPVLADALKVAKRVRPVTEGKIGHVSLAEIAMRHVWEHLVVTPGAVALLGVSPMTEQCARALRARDVGVVIVNRTLARAQALADEIGASAMSLDGFRATPPAVEVVLTATGASEPVLTRGDLERLAARTPSGCNPLVVDMGVPPNVAPEDALAADVPRVGMDVISDEAALDRDRLLGEFADARALVDEALTDLRRRMAERLVGPMVAELRRRYRHTALEGVDRLLEKELAGIGPEERDVIRQWAETLARRFAHVPSVGLRELAVQAGPDAVEAFFLGAEPELAHAVREAAERALVLEPEFDD